MNMRLTVEMIRGWGPCYDPVTMLHDEGWGVVYDLIDGVTYQGLDEDWAGPLSEILNISRVPISDRVWVAARALPPKNARLFACWCAAMAHRDRTEAYPAAIAAIRVARLHAHGRATAYELAAAKAAVLAAAKTEVAYCRAYYTAADACEADAAKAAHKAAARIAREIDGSGIDKNREREMQLWMLKRITKRLEAKAMNEKIRVAGPNEEYCDRRCPFITVLPTGVACINPRHAGSVKWSVMAGSKPWRPVRRKACIDATNITISRAEYDWLKAAKAKLERYEATIREAMIVFKDDEAGRGSTASMGMPSAGKPKSNEEA